MTTPIVDPGRPLDLGSAISGPFKVYRRGFGPFLLSMAMPAAAVVALCMVATGIMVGGLVGSARSGGAPTFAIIMGSLFFLAAMVAGALLAIKSNGMIVQGTFDIVQGHRPTFGDLWRRTPGVVGRMLVLVLLSALAYVLFYVVIIIALVVPMAASAAAGDEDGALMALSSLWINFLSLLIYAGVFVLAVKLMFLLPEVTVQRRDGLEALKSSWALTKGRFWKLLGYFLLFSFVVGLIMYAIMFVGVIIMMVGVVASIPSVEAGEFPAGMIVSFFLGYAFILAGIALCAPLTMIFQTLMYADRLNESPHTGNAWTGQPGGPGGFPGPGQPGQHGQSQQYSYGQGQYNQPGQPQQGQQGQWRPENPNPGGGQWGQNPGQQGFGQQGGQQNPWGRPGPGDNPYGR